ncbi:MAG: hypothetical protein JJLCMIEE_00681 [Acidimicrobiales bacterium]|nr:hypothetical protein [Acidimicrobiales bacterium]
MATRKPPVGLKPVAPKPDASKPESPDPSASSTASTQATATKPALGKSAFASASKDPRTDAIGKEVVGSDGADDDEGPASNEQQAVDSYTSKPALDIRESGQSSDQQQDSVKEGTRDRFTGGLGQTHDQQQGGITQEDLDQSFEESISSLSGREDAYDHYTQGLTPTAAHDHQGAGSAGKGGIAAGAGREGAGSAPIAVKYDSEGLDSGAGGRALNEEYKDSALGKVAKFYETGGPGSPRAEMLLASEDDGTHGPETHQSKDGVVKVTKHQDGTVVVENTENNTQTTQKPDGSTFTKDLTTGKIIEKTDAPEHSGDPSEAPAPVLHGPDFVAGEIDELRAAFEATRHAAGSGDVDPEPEDGAESPVGAAVPDAHSEQESMLGNPGNPGTSGSTDGFGSGHGFPDSGDIDPDVDAADPNTVGRSEEIDVSPGGDTIGSPPPDSEADFDGADDSATTSLLPASGIADTVAPDDFPDDLPDHLLDVDG